MVVDKVRPTKENSEEYEEYDFGAEAKNITYEEKDGEKKTLQDKIGELEEAGGGGNASSPTAANQLIDDNGINKLTLDNGTLIGSTNDEIGGVSIAGIDNISANSFTQGDKDISSIYAPINNPTFTGEVKAPTVEQSNNDSKVATTAFVKTAIGDLIGDAPETMDTLKELSDAIAEHKEVTNALNSAIGNKTNKSDFEEYQSTVNTEITGIKSDINNKADQTSVNTLQSTINGLSSIYAPIANPTFTGSAKAPTPTSTSSDDTIATTSFVKNQISSIISGINKGFNFQRIPVKIHGISPVCTEGNENNIYFYYDYESQIYFYFGKGTTKAKSNYKGGEPIFYVPSTSLGVDFIIENNKYVDQTGHGSLCVALTSGMLEASLIPNFNSSYQLYMRFTLNTATTFTAGRPSYFHGIGYLVANKI